eukprot:3722877-Rhodomonas_salina.1
MHTAPTRCTRRSPRREDRGRGGGDGKSGGSGCADEERADRGQGNAALGGQELRREVSALSEEAARALRRSSSAEQSRAEQRRSREWERAK